MIEINQFKNFKKVSGIYKFTINKHIYIGSSINLYDRLKQHLWDLKNQKHHNSTFQNCYNKYGDKYLTFEVIETCPADILLKREAYYIQLINADINQIKDPTNIKMSDISKWRLSTSLKEINKRKSVWNKRKVYQYDITGEFIKEYDSLTEASKYTRICHATIKKCIENNSKCPKYIWKLDYSEKVTPLIEDNKSVIQLQDEKIINKFSNLKEASIKTGIEIYNIYQSCKQFIPCKEFKFRFEKVKVNCSIKLRKPVYCYSLDGNFIKRYSYANEAAMALGISKYSISAVCKKGKNKSAAGYLWSYEKHDKLPKYVNNSSKSKIKSVKLFDLITNNELSFNSLADAVRYSTFTNFETECATLSSCIHKYNIYQNRYLCTFKNNVYNINLNWKYLYNSNTNIIINNSQILSNEDMANGWHYLVDSAREKLRESGKDFLEVNPNLSSIEI